MTTITSGPLREPLFDQSAWAARYSALLYGAAEQWGVQLPPEDERPLIEDCTAPFGGRLPVVETLRWQSREHSYHYAEIEVVYFNGMWSFALDCCFPKSGTTFGARMKFCPPYSSRAAALDAAAQRVLRCLGDSHAPGLAAWLDAIRAPVQLSLLDV